MSYEQLVETISLIVENDKIYKNGLTLVYILDKHSHETLNREIFYKSNHIQDDFVLSDEFEVMINNILIKFIKK